MIEFIKTKFLLNNQCFIHRSVCPTHAIGIGKKVGKLELFKQTYMERTWNIFIKFRKLKRKTTNSMNKC